MITCLHGFLGLPSDWDFLRDAGLAIRAIDLFRGEAVPETGDTLLGYSMGGRLALATLASGATYRRAVIVSAGLNLSDDKERLERRVHDQRWAERFQSDSWDDLTADWNRQAIFGGHTVDREEADFDRVELGKALRQWSSGSLPPLEPHLEGIAIPILWIAGENDERYLDAAKRAIALLPRGELAIAPGAGHRVPWEQPDWFADRVREFTTRNE